MNNYYNELSQLSILEQEINRFATSLQNKKAGCFTHRFEALLNVLPNEFRNQVNFRNKIQDYIKKSNYEKDVKDYVLQVFLSFFEPIEIKVPNSLRNVVEKNESYNKAMIEGYLNFEKAMIEQQPETDKPDEVTIKHPKHNPNYWNTDCFELFKYLYDEYYKGTKRQITNIWFYLKEYNNQKYILSITKDLYKDFINENYKIAITNFDKAQQKWEDKEYKKLDEHRQNFEDGLK